MKRSCTVTWALYRLERWNARWHLHTTSYIYSSCACVIQTRCLLFSSLFGWWYYCTSTRRICWRIFFFPIQIKSFPSNTEIDCLQQQPFFFGGGGAFYLNTSNLGPLLLRTFFILSLVFCLPVAEGDTGLSLHHNALTCYHHIRPTFFFSLLILCEVHREKKCSLQSLIGKREFL